MYGYLNQRCLGSLEATKSSCDEGFPADIGTPLDITYNNRKLSDVLFSDESHKERCKS